MCKVMMPFSHEANHQSPNPMILTARGARGEVDGFGLERCR